MIIQTLPAPPQGKSGWPWLAEPESVLPTMPDSVPWPKISVVTPSFNQGLFIEETIRSVLLQGYPNLEFIIIDGGSTDSTLEIIRKYELWLSYWVSESDRGQSHAVNKGIVMAGGEIILWLNSDDLVLPGAFTAAASHFARQPGLGMVIGQAKIINSDGQVTGDLRSYFTRWEDAAVTPRNSVRQVSTFFHCSLFDTYGLLDESLHIAMDSELLIRFTHHSEPLVIDDYLAAFRVHGDAKTASQLVQGYNETDRVRPQLLAERRLHHQYRRNSAGNWLSLAESSNYSTNERRNFILKALQLQPTALLHRRFWSLIRRMLFRPDKN